MTIKIVFSSTKSAPLFAQYQGQVAPQPAYIELDLQTGDVDADYSGEVGSGMPVDVWHGVRRRYTVRNDLTADQVREAIDDIKPLLQRVLDGAEVIRDDNANLVGRLNDDAESAEDELEQMEPLGRDMEGLVITDLTDWLMASGEGVWLPGPYHEIKAFIEDFDLDGYVTGQDLGDTLRDMWAEHLYAGNPVPANIAKDLISDGRCDESAWMYELRANARDEIHDNQDD